MAQMFETYFLVFSTVILIKMSLKFVPGDSFGNEAVLMQVMTRCQTGDKSLIEQVMTQTADAILYWKATMSQHIETETKWPLFPRRHLQVDILESRHMNVN